MKKCMLNQELMNSGYVEKMESLTRPNESMTLRELIDRFAFGDVPEGRSDGYFDDDDEDFFDNPTQQEDFDFAAAHELQMELNFKQSFSDSDLSKAASFAVSLRSPLKSAASRPLSESAKDCLKFSSICSS